MSHRSRTVIGEPVGLVEEDGEEGYEETEYGLERNGLLGAVMVDALAS